MTRARANADATSQTYIENATAAQELSGTYATERLYFNDSYQLTGNVTVTGHLALGTIADADVVITQDGTERTITTDASGGTLVGGNVLQDTHRTSVTGMTGELGSAVTGSPNLNLGNATFPANVAQGYEEGTHECAVTMASGTCALSESYNKVRYTKIGKLVTIQGQIQVYSVSSPSGSMGVSMPFSMDTTSDEGSNISGGVVRTYLGNAPTGGLYCHGTMVFNQGVNCELQWSKSGSATIAHVPVAGEYLVFNFSYLIA